MKRLCPQCRENYSQRTWLRLVARFKTSWYGVLRWWRCRVCGNDYVTKGNGPAEDAII